MRRREFCKKAVLTAGGLSLGSVAASGADSPRLRAAVIGYTGHGDYGHSLDTIFKNREEVEVVAVADPDETGRARAAKKIGAARSYADFHELLAAEKPGLVSIAMRQAAFHYPIALAALKANAHIYCEKPFTTTPAEADELLSEADGRGLKIAVAHTMRMMPVIRQLRNRIAEGFIGELVEMRAYGKQDARAGGEDMIVLGSHLFDLMRMFAGDPESCSARVLSRGKAIVIEDARRVEDDDGPVAGDEVFAEFGFPGGVTGTFTSAAKLRETVGHWGIEMYGSKGAARINCDLSPNVFVRSSTNWSAEGKTDSWKPMPPDGHGGVEHNAGPVGDWLEALAKGREPECSGRNGAWAVEMVMAVYQSALSGSRIRFPLKRRTHPLQR